MVVRFLRDRWPYTNYIEGTKEMDWTRRRAAPGPLATNYHPPVTTIPASARMERAAPEGSAIPSPRAVSAAAARRFLVLRHFLAPPRALHPGEQSVLDVLQRLGSLQFDPLEVAGRNHDLVLHARISGYRREMTDSLLYERRLLFEAYNKGLSILPAAELPLYRLTWDQARVGHDGGAFDEHAPLVEELLDRIRRDGPLSSTDILPRAAIDWYWRPTNPVRAILEALAEAGILGITRRDGNRRVYDLAERLFPVDLLAQRRTVREQVRHRLLSRYRANGLLGTGGQAELWIGTGPAAPDSRRPGHPTRTELRAELLADGTLVPVAVEGLRGPRLVVASDLPLLGRAVAEAAAGLSPGGAAPAVSFLAPLDPFCWDRDLLRGLFGFHYVWEVYVPGPKRRWGYYVLPVLFGDRLVGRIEPRIDRPARAIRVLGTWWEPGFDPLDAEGFVPAFASALTAYRAFGGANRVTFPRDRSGRALAGAVARAG
jgi:uncharacterized protein YcaQ